MASRLTRPSVPQNAQRTSLGLNIQKLLALFLAFLPFGACASTGSGSDGDRVRITLHDYRNGQFFELAGESHTNRVEYYSTSRSSAARKIITDTKANSLANEMLKRGFKKNHKPGRAPSQGGSLLTWGLEVSRNDEIQHWVVGKGTEIGQQQEFQKTRKAFLDMYNAAFSFQTIENEKGRSFFDRQTRRANSSR